MGFHAIDGRKSEYKDQSGRLYSAVGAKNGDATTPEVKRQTKVPSIHMSILWKGDLI